MDSNESGDEEEEAAQRLPPPTLGRRCETNKECVSRPGRYGLSLFFSCIRIDSFARMACESCFSKRQHCRLPEKEQELTEWETKTSELFTEATDALKHIASLLEGLPLKRHVVPLGGSPTVVVVAPTEGQGGNVSVIGEDR